MRQQHMGPDYCTKYCKRRKFNREKFSMISPSKRFCSFNFHCSMAMPFYIITKENNLDLNFHGFASWAEIVDWTLSYMPQFHLGGAGNGCFDRWQCPKVSSKKIVYFLQGGRDGRGGAKTAAPSISAWWWHCQTFHLQGGRGQWYTKCESGQQYLQIGMWI